MATVRLELGNCITVMAAMPENSVDAVICDPPYALPGGFMGTHWDNFDGREDTAFGYWLAGFTDGEGAFIIKRHERGSHACTFQIKLRADDKKVLERIRKYIGYGTIDPNPGNNGSQDQYRYVVQDKEGCGAVVSLFRRFPLTAKKANDFEVWAEAVEEWLERPRGNRWQGASDQTDAAALKKRLENTRRYVEIPWSGHRFQDWVRQWAAEALRILKPGGHLLAFGSTRTYHRLAAGIEDAGFEIRDSFHWVFGSGMPKSYNLDRLRGESICGCDPPQASTSETRVWPYCGACGLPIITKGLGTALKPAHEPIVMARKSLDGTVITNVLTHRTGALNIDASRVGSDPVPVNRLEKWSGFGELKRPAYVASFNTGRWPANVIHDGSDEVLKAFPFAPGQQAAVKGDEPSTPTKTVYGARKRVAFGTREGEASADRRYTENGATNFAALPGERRFDTGSAARFFYTAKPSKKERSAGLDAQQFPDGNNHETVKPIALMAYLINMVTPPGGLVVDPFVGSGTTGIAAVQCGFDFLGIELDAKYIEIAKARIAAAVVEAGGVEFPSDISSQEEIQGAATTAY